MTVASLKQMRVRELGEWRNNPRFVVGTPCEKTNWLTNLCDEPQQPSQFVTPMLIKTATKRSGKRAQQVKRKEIRLKDGRKSKSNRSTDIKLKIDSSKTDKGVKSEKQATVQRESTVKLIKEAQAQRSRVKSLSLNLSRARKETPYVTVPSLWPVALIGSMRSGKSEVIASSALKPQWGPSGTQQFPYFGACSLATKVRHLRNVFS